MDWLVECDYIICMEVKIVVYRLSRCCFYLSCATHVDHLPACIDLLLQYLFLPCAYFLAYRSQFNNTIIVHDFVFAITVVTVIKFESNQHTPAVQKNVECLTKLVLKYTPTLYYGIACLLYPVSKWMIA